MVNFTFHALATIIKADKQGLQGDAMPFGLI